MTLNILSQFLFGGGGGCFHEGKLLYTPYENRMMVICLHCLLLDHHLIINSACGVEAKQVKFKPKAYDSDIKDTEAEFFIN